MYELCLYENLDYIIFMINKYLERFVKMETKRELMTVEGKKKLEDELYYLKTIKRKENSQDLKEARGQGDLSENAEYDAAKDEQSHMEARIAEIEEILKNAEVVTYDEIDKNKINLGYNVTILDMETKDELLYKVVGSSESDIEEGKISVESPLGKALMKKKKGDIVNVEAPIGIIKYKILDFNI